MKTLKHISQISLILLVIALVPSLVAQEKFEGKVIINVSGKEGNNSITYFVKNNKARFDMTSERGESNVVFDRDNKKMIMMMPAMKMYMEFPTGMIDNQVKTNKKKDKAVDFTRTGETKVINGYKCEKWTMNEGGGVTEAWMADGLGEFIFFDSPMQRNSKTEWQKGITGSGAFPMLVVHKDADGNTTKNFEVKSVEKMKLDDSFFSIPKGYSQMKMPMKGEK